VTLLDFSTPQLLAISLIFVWSGFVRAGLGFGGAALALPLLLMVIDQPLFFLPIVATHLLIFSSITAGRSFKNIDQKFLRESLTWMIIPKLAGVIGLLSLPNQWMVLIIYGITGFYAITWTIKWEISSQSPWVDRLLLVLGGYFSGASLIGAPPHCCCCGTQNGDRVLPRHLIYAVVYFGSHKNVCLCHCWSGLAMAMVIGTTRTHRHRPLLRSQVSSTNAQAQPPCGTPMARRRFASHYYPCSMAVFLSVITHIN